MGALAVLRTGSTFDDRGERLSFGHRKVVLEPDIAGGKTYALPLGVAVFNAGALGGDQKQARVRRDKDSARVEVQPSAKARNRFVGRKADAAAEQESLG